MIMGEDFNFGSILDESEINDLFSDGGEAESNEKPSESDGKEKPQAGEEKENKKNVTDGSIESIFGQESVGGDKKDAEEGKGSSTEAAGASPNNFSSIAKALKEDGPLSSVNDEFFDKINDAQGFSDAIEEEVRNRLDESQRRILEALDNNVEPNEIRQYENTLKYLDSITEENITDESDKGAELRKALIYQDFINKGYSKEKATRMLNKTISDGTDIEDAKDALEANRKYYKDSYDDLREEAKRDADERREEYRRLDESLKKSIMDDKEVVKGIGELDRTTRQKAYDAISKPVYKDKQTGRVYSAVQRFEKENPVEFRKVMGLVYALTDGYKSFDTLVKSKVDKEREKGIAELERVINSTPRNGDGSYRLANGGGDDSSFLDGIVALDL